MTGAALEIIRVTMAFNDAEDRISLTCALPGSEYAVLWLTARLARQLIPHLLQEAERSPEAPQIDKEDEGSGVGASEACNTAVTAGPNTPSWLVTAIDMRHGPFMVRLCFRGAERYPSVYLELEHTRLSLWLAGLKQCYIQADWPMDCWQGKKNVSPTLEITPQITLH